MLKGLGARYAWTCIDNTTIFGSEKKNVALLRVKTDVTDNDYMSPYTDIQ